RGLAMLFGSLQHEVHIGRAFRRPHTALLKTFYRARKALRAPATLPPAPTPAVELAEKPKPAEPKPTEPEPAAPIFPPYQPVVAARPAPITIATILDTFSESCFRYEANLVPLSVKGWREEMESHRPAFLLCESAWLGNGGQWQYTMSKYAAREHNPLRELLAWCKQQGIPRVFWNKEDPSNFDVFKDVAAEFDHVFTTDADCIPRYRQLLGHDRVYALPFAAQPAIHNPIQDRLKRNRSVCFAGSWRARKYPERATDSEVLLGPALDLGLEIFDRNAGGKHAAEMAFPAPYAGAVRGALDYDAMLSAYRGYKVFLNVNSIKSSPTMFARRVFELMACGTPVVSSDSAGIRAMLGTLVKIANTPEETRTHLERLLGDGDYRGRFAHAGYREVLERHTYRHRLREILARLGIEASPPEPPLVTILAGTNRPDRIANLLGSIRRQVHPHVEPILLLNADAYDQRAVEEAAADLPRLKVFKLPESYTLAECLNHGLEHASGAWVAKLDDDDFYGPHYLSDLLLATAYTDARVLGKRSVFCWLEGSGQLVHRFPEQAHRHVEHVQGATLFIRRDVFDQVQFSPVIRGTDTVFQRHCRARGIDIYAADPYNYIVVRQADAATHTWHITDEQVLARSRPVATRLDMGLVMI
ncbi:MAG TPA: glycosyltransferase, partial [Kofleriaceae bacterium]|nr:glycosyltransferase [Kofleriaceae bacterium]